MGCHEQRLSRVSRVIFTRWTILGGAGARIQLSKSRFNFLWAKFTPYLAGLITFRASSLVCAPRSIATITSRTIAAVGGAVLYSGAIYILELAAPM